jgi:mannose-6-phosphate isomerase-like protein (cupin superfamily)
MTTLLELRVYKLKSGTRARFDQIFRTGALPMLRRHGISVVGYGPSIHDEDSYCLLRAYASAEERTRKLDAFYGSEEWLTRYDAEVIGMIETYNTVVLPASSQAASALAKELLPDPPPAIIPLATAENAPPKPGRKTPLLLQYGAMEVRYYAPRGIDDQTSHDRDEIYVVATGRGTFVRGSERAAFATGDLLFVAAGVEHRFEAFSDDLGLWVMFF